MKGKKLLAGIMSAALVLCTMAIPAFAEAGNGTQTNPYTLAEFNELTDVSGQELWVNLGDLNILENSVTLGSYVMSDEYQWVNKNAEVPEGFTATERENAQGTAIAYRTNKAGATIHISGTITAKNGAENINDHINTKCLYFQIPEKSTIILDSVTINGVFDLVGSYTYYYNMPDGSIAHQLTANKPSWATNIWYGFPFSINKIEINNSTINGCWFNNGRNFNNVSIYNTEFKSYENTVSANSSNPIWWQNIPGLESFTMTDSKLTSTRPIKFESSSNPAFNVSFTGNTFTMESGSKFTKKESDKTKNAAIYFGKSQNFGDVNISNNTISGDEHTQLVVISENADITKMSVAEKISITNNKKADGSALSVRESIGMWKSEIDTPWDSALAKFLSNDNVELYAKWQSDTDSGYYMDNETKYGMMRFMFKTEPTGTVTASGIKYINAKDISKSVTANTAAGATVFQGDVVKVDEGTEGTYYARAYITTQDGTTFWSAPVGCSVNWNRFFTKYTGGVQ